MLFIETYKTLNQIIADLKLATLKKLVLLSAQMDIVVCGNVKTLFFKLNLSRKSEFSLRIFLIKMLDFGDNKDSKLDLL